MKNLEGSMGRKVRLAKTKPELNMHLAELGYPIILQKYVPIEADYRVMVVGGKVLGAMKRYKKEEDFLTTRAGGKRERATLPEVALQVATEAARISGLDVAGVDIVEHEGKWFRLEVNMSPQFRIFEEVTKVNVAKAIIEMLIAKHR